MKALNLWDIPAPYLLGGLAAWIALTLTLFVRERLIAAAVVFFYFLAPPIQDLLSKNDIPQGQILLILFGPAIFLCFAFKERTRFRLGDILPLLVFVVGILISIIYNNLSLWEHKIELQPMALSLLIYAAINTRQDLETALKAFLVFFAVNTIVAAVQYFGGPRFYLPSHAQAMFDIGGFKRGVGLADHFSQSGLYGGGVTAFSLVGLAYARTSASFIRRFLWCLTGVTAVSLASVRAGLIGGVLGGLTAILLFEPRKTPRYALTFAVLAVAALSAPALKESSLALVRHASTLDGSALMRPRLASIGLAYWAESPLLGHAHDLKMRLNMDTGLKQYFDAHNTYINVLKDYGLLGLTGFLATLASLQIRLWRRASLETANRDLYVGLFAMVACCLIFGAFHSINYTGFLWYVVGLGLAAPKALRPLAESSSPSPR